MTARTTINNAERDGEQLVVRYRRPDDTWQAALVIPVCGDELAAWRRAKWKVDELQAAGRQGVEVTPFTPKI